MVNAVVRDRSKNANEVTVADFTPAQIETIRKMKRRVQQFDQIRSFRTERRAYDGENQVGKWLLNSAKDYFRSKGRVPMSFLEPTSDDFIIQHYGINPAWLEKLKTGRCESL